MRRASIVGSRTSAGRSERSSESSSAHSVQEATCASTASRITASSRPFTSSGSRSRRSPFVHSFIELLPDGPHRIVIMHSRSALRASDCDRYLLVRQSLRHAQREDRALHRRQGLDCRTQPLLGFRGDRSFECARGAHEVAIVHLYLGPRSLAPPLPVSQEIPRDREQPRSKAALPPERVQRSERSNEGILHHFLPFIALTNAHHDSRARLRAPFVERRGRSLVPASPPRDQRCVVGCEVAR